MSGIFQDFGAESRSRGVNGVAIGIVTNNEDPDGMGRVKLKFPWSGGSDESYWVRVATLMAGKDRGTFFLPEVEDEVLVAFDHGDINYPYVIGALWNGVDTPPRTNEDGKNNIRTIKSRSGHEIIFNDNHEEKEEKIEIRTKSSHAIVLDDSEGNEKIEILTKTGHAIVLDDSEGNEKIEIRTKTGHAIVLGENIEIKDKTGNNSIIIDSAQNAIAMSSQAKLSIKSQMIEIESGGTMSIKSTGPLTIQGAIVQIN